MNPPLVSDRLNRVIGALHLVRVVASADRQDVDAGALLGLRELAWDALADVKALTKALSDDVLDVDAPDGAR